MADETQYQSLYRKYRPQGPSEVLGQEHVVRALVGAVRENRLAHAFLFCGPRGTGKTSTARILAKMVNCEKAPTPEPCGVCEQCVRIREGTHLDVVEIDAASHGGVDDARELRERAPTAPAMGREKVYIIDEAQRLSREAFDALLKVFEEPPPGVRFVLATTEPHKMPATIVGRCQRFDFRRGTSDMVADHLLRIAKEESIALDEQAALALARQAEGSFRDALSLLDQASVLGGGKIGEEAVAALLGAPRGEIQHELADAIAVGDTRSVFAVVDRLVQEGEDLRHVTAEVLKHFRNLLLVQTASGPTDVPDVAADEYERLRAQAAKFSSPEVSRIIGLLLAAQTDMRWTTSPRLTLELALVRASMPEADPAPEALISRIERLERLAGVEPEARAEATAQGVVAAAVAGRGDPSADGVEPMDAAAVPGGEDPSAEGGDRSGKQAAAKRDPVVAPPSTSDVDIDMLRRSWTAVVDRLKSARQMILFSNLQSVTPASYDGDTLELAFPPNRSFGVEKVEQRLPKVQEVLQEIFGVSPRIRCVVREPVTGGPSIDDTPPPSEEAALARLKAEFDAEITDGES